MSRRLPQLLLALWGVLSVALLAHQLSLALAIAQPDSRVTLLAAVAGVALIALLEARHAAVSIRSRVLTVGSRSRQHRESFSSIPEPSHPHTAGRTRSRAPARSLAAA